MSARESAKVDRVRSALLDFYAAHKRDLPWRRTKDPYAIWVSEIMLQQTRVETVIPFYAAFLDRFPTVLALADAPIDDVLSRWSGLGYYRRARMLHAAARVVADDHRGAIPKTAEALLTLPGVGRYTAGAIASIAHDEPAPIVDGNVLRVVARVFGIEREVSPADEEIWALAGALASGPRPGDLNQAIMELGATVCAKTAPRCLTCPLHHDCVARARGTMEKIPALAQKKKSPIVRMAALVVKNKDAVLLLRRAETGLFGGLWEPPMIESRANARPAEIADAFSSVVGQSVSIGAGTTTVRHVLTHRDLRVAVYSGTVARAARSSMRVAAPYEAARFVGAHERRDLGVSRLCTKIIDAAAEKETAPKKLR